jgi:hypothetical protein
MAQKVQTETLSDVAARAGQISEPRRPDAPLLTTRRDLTQHAPERRVMPESNFIKN